MDAQLEPNEILSMRELMGDYAPGQMAIDTLLKNDGSLEGAFDDLWIEHNGKSPVFGEGKSLLQVTLDVLRKELCGGQ